MNLDTGHELEELIAAGRAGNLAARGQALERFRNYLLLLARVQIGRRIQGKADPADLVQETFLEAHRHFERFRGSTEPELACWLRQILAGRLGHLLRRYLGTRQRDVRLERDLAAQLDQSSRMAEQGLMVPQSTPSQRASRREQAVLLADALDRLPEDYRDVLVFRQLEGLSFPEISRRMERSGDSVKKLWVRALARLRMELGGEL